MHNEIKNFNFNLTPGSRNFNNKLIAKHDKILVSIITAWNTDEYIYKELENSILNQTFPFWEWFIIINDNDNYVSKLAKKDNRIKVIVKNEKCNLDDILTREAKGDYICQISSNCSIDSTFLECSYWTLKTNPSVSIVTSNYVVYGNNVDLENTLGNTFVLKKQKAIDVKWFFVEKNFNKKIDLLEPVFKDLPLMKMNYYGFWYKENVIGKRLNEQLNNKMVKFKAHIISFPLMVDTTTLLAPKTYNWSGEATINDSLKKNLLFIFPWFTIGGGDKFNLDLISRIDKNKFNITIITTESSRYILRQEFERYATIYDLTTFLNQKDWAGFIHYIMQTRKIDLVFLGSSFYGYYVSPWLKTQFSNVPFVDYLHAEDFSWRNGGYPRDSVAVSNILDTTYTCTNYLKNLMCDKMDRKNSNIKVVYIGVDEKIFDPSDNKIEKLDLDKYNGKKIILFACRIVELKRPIFVLHVMKKILSKRNDVALFVVGDGEQLAEMKKCAKIFGIYDSVTFFGMKKDLRPYYMAASVTLITSLTEGLTLTAYESLAMGVPVITSDVGGQRELIDEKCGRVIRKYQNVEEDLFNRNYSDEEIENYVSVICDVIDSKNYSSMKKYCRTKILKGFTIDNMVSDLSSEFIRLTKDKSKCNFSDEELAKEYLSMYIRSNPLYYGEKNFNNVWTFKTKMRERLWSIPLWRFFVKIIKKALRRK